MQNISSAGLHPPILIAGAPTGGIVLIATF